MGFITKFMTSDHAYIDKLWSNFLNESQNPDLSVKLFNKFKTHLSLHIKLEDEFLFPRLSDHLQLGANSGIVQVASQDHKVIFKLLGFVAEALTAGDFEKVKSAGRNFNRALTKHQARELEIQYPVSDSFIQPEEWEQMVKEIYGAGFKA